MTIHVVKSWPRFFEPLFSGTRTHELRRNDRDYRVGDWLELHEYDPETQEFTGRTCAVAITSLTTEHEACAVSGEALHHDFCILSVKRRPWSLIWAAYK
jgi:hypothetical protein